MGLSNVGMTRPTALARAVRRLRAAWCGRYCSSATASRTRCWVSGLARTEGSALRMRDTRARSTPAFAATSAIVLRRPATGDGPAASPRSLASVTR